MKKIKIMLLSLALFAVVGGALAFKAKFDQDWCTAPAYHDVINDTYYCVFTVGAEVTTKDCEDFDPALTNDLDPNAVKSVCTTEALAPELCPEDCPITTTTEGNGGRG